MSVTSAGSEVGPPGLSRDYDPITFSVLLNRFENIVEEMTITLEFCAWSSMLALGHDYSCAIYDSLPRQICMFDALPVHTTSMHLVLSEIAETFEGEVHEGDVFLCNAPYRRNTHVGDVVAATPVFHEGRHLFWSVTRAHQMDIGASVPCSVSAAVADVWQEGLHIPPVRVYAAGSICKDIVNLYVANMRYPDLLKGDLMAMLGSIARGKVRLLEVIADYGPDEAMRYVDAIIDYSDRRMTEAIRAMPDGEYFAEGWVDSDGRDKLNVPIKVKVTISDDRVNCDYSGSAPQAPSGLNCSYAVSQASPAVPFMYYIDQEIPHNHGCFSHIESYAPEGSMCNAKYPASTSCATVVPSDLMQDLVNMAMAQAIPNLVPAGTSRAQNLPQYTGIDERTGKPWGSLFFNNSGGGGASKGNDGWPLMATLAALGGLRSQLIEQLELLYPLLVEQWEIEPDSMGFGEWNGGPGVRFSTRPTRGPVEVITFGDSCDNPPHGVLGGTPGIGGGQYVESLEEGPRRYYSACAYFAVKMGDRRIAVSTGGGGYGRAECRDAEQVRRDVRDGIVSREAAGDVFGVVLIGDPLDPQIDIEATATRRTKLAAVQRPIVDPTTPGAATWLKQNMREGDEYILNPTFVSPTDLRPQAGNGAQGQAEGNGE